MPSGRARHGYGQLECGLGSRALAWGVLDFDACLSDVWAQQGVWDLWTRGERRNEHGGTALLGLRHNSRLGALPRYRPVHRCSVDVVSGCLKPLPRSLHPLPDIPEIHHTWDPAYPPRALLLHRRQSNHAHSHSHRPTPILIHALPSGLLGSGGIPSRSPIHRSSDRSAPPPHTREPPPHRDSAISVE